MSSRLSDMLEIDTETMEGHYKGGQTRSRGGTRRNPDPVSIGRILRKASNRDGLTQDKLDAAVAAVPGIHEARLNGRSKPVIEVYSISLGITYKAACSQLRRIIAKLDEQRIEAQEGVLVAS